MKRLFAIGVLAALAACGQPAEEAAPPPAEPVLDVSIGPRGAAGITEAIPLTVEAVTAAAPGYVVAEGEDQIEGNAYRVVTLSLNNEVVFTLNPTADGASLHSVITKSPQAHGPLGDVIGSTTAERTPQAWMNFCEPMLYEGEHGFVCSTDEAGAFWRVFVLPDVYAGPYAPFGAIDPDMLAISMLREMRWIAPRTAPAQ